ncbi:calcium-binding protein [Sphingomonas sabuli]|uniref:Calcium-binding protein n=1 Tax=Sphingomonas sabuli TaxID=2764186 RepID=A0A7G9KZJ2_9SPHN|nr:calcium-binding protein [Sphingomonas sabuli]QNM81791.1 calcium-binding protein [Sphingomonas sabuli]
MKTLFLAGAAALGAAAFAPVLAQAPTPAPAPQASDMHHGMRMGPVTRAAMLEKVQSHFAKLDADRNGVVTAAEMDAMRAQHQGRMGQRGEKRFDRLDANDDQAISKAEFDAAHAKMGDHRGKGMRMGGMGGRMIMRMADANKDGNVSLQEATAAAATHFDQADANRDGTLTREEMRAARKAHMGKRGA